MKGGTALGRVLGHGSAKQGAHHWWVQRVTSVALVPLSIWFVVSLARLPVVDHASVAAWIGGALTAVLLCVFVLCASWHSHLGVQVVVEDYVHAHGPKLATLLLSTFAHVLVAAAGVFAVLKVAFGTH